MSKQVELDKKAVKMLEKLKSSKAAKRKVNK